MKLFKRFFTLFVAFLLLISFAACGKNAGSKSDGSSDEYEVIEGGGGFSGRDSIDGKGGTEYYSHGDLAPDSTSGMIPGESGEPVEGGSEEEWQQKDYPAGLITAAAWNENEHYAFWQSLFLKGQTEEENGKFSSFYEKNRWGFDSTSRVKVTVKAEDTLVCGASVVCLDENGEERFAAKTGADGVAYLFPEISAGTIRVTSGEGSAETTFSSEQTEVEVSLSAFEEKTNKIKLMLVLDVTGSMGDELWYLQTELKDVISRVAENNEGVQIDLALLFYRDEYDSEEFAYHDFVNVNSQSGLTEQLTVLSRQSAMGGDDYPEAVDEALEMAMEKDWGEDNSTKLIFHLLDAPPHENREGKQRNYERHFELAVRKAAEKGIRLCPILCSGADDLCEYLVRQEAIYTGGTFIFITDHSGIGGAHHDPNLPNAVVEALNDLMVRVINGYHTGEFADPVPWRETTGTNLEDPTIVEYEGSIKD